MKDGPAAGGARPRIVINPPVFFTSSLLALAFVGFRVIAPDAVTGMFGAMRDWTLESAGWFYVLSVTRFLDVLHQYERHLHFLHAVP